MSSIDPNREHLDAIKMKCADLRGTILNEVASLDTILTDFLAKYLCNDDTRRGILFVEVLGAEGLTFSAKTKVFKKILEREIPDWKKEYPRLIKEIDDIRDFRNRLAHLMPDTSARGFARASENAALFADFGSAGQQFVVTGDEGMEWRRRIAVAVGTMVDVRERILGAT